jgi:hypothetical protein
MSANNEFELEIEDINEGIEAYAVQRKIKLNPP